MVKKKISDKKTNNNLVIGIIVILLLIGVFWYFNSDKEEMEYGDSLKQSAIGNDYREITEEDLEITRKEVKDLLREEFDTANKLKIKLMLKAWAKDLLRQQHPDDTEREIRNRLRDLHREMADEAEKD